MSELTAIKNNEILKPFFDRNQDVDLLSFKFFDQNALTSLNWESLDQDPIVDRLKACQRLLRLGVDAQEAMALSESDRKLDSALAIASLSETAFVEAANFSNPEKAKTVHRQAREKTAGLMVFLANAIQFSSPRQATALFDSAQSIRNSLGDIPSYPELFGSLDYLQCEPCQSIFSPSAYFVDLMRMVEEYIVETDDNLSLNGRRPDLENILLTCDNTNDTVPYTQIVSEVLEEKLKKELEGEDVFKHLATVLYPRNLPFNIYLEQMRIYLGNLETSLADIYQTFHPQQPDSMPWAREYLGLSPEDYNLIITENANAGSLSDRYGVTVSESDLGGLDEKDIFLKQTKLSWQELNDLLYQNLSSGDEGEIEKGVADQFYINQGLSDEDTNEDTKKYIYLNDEDKIKIKVLDSEEDEELTLGALDRIDRFLRLAAKLDWSFADLDWVLASISSDGTKKIDEKAIKKIAQIKRLEVQTKLPLDVLCSFWHDMKTIGKGDKPERRPQDLFNRIFNNPFIFQGQEEFPPAEPWEIDGTDERNSLLRKRLLAALKLKDKDFHVLVKGMFPKQESIPLDIANLSRLFRNAQVLNLLGLKGEEYQLLLKFLDQSLQSPEKLDIEELIAIADLAQWLKASGFTLYELDYILYGIESTSVEVVLPENNLESLMESLWENVQLPEGDLSDEQRNELNETIAQMVGIEPGLFSILAPVGAEGEDYIKLLLTPVETGTDEWERIVRCLKYISQMYLLVFKLPLTDPEITSVINNRKAYNIQSLTELKVGEVETLYRFKHELVGHFDEPDNGVIEYLEKPSIKDLAELTGWNQQQIQQVIDYFNPSQEEPSEEEPSGEEEFYDSVEGLLKLKGCFDLSLDLGCRVQILCDLCDLLKDGAASEDWETYKNQANSIVNLTQAKYGYEEWIEVFGKLNGAVTERQSQILSEFALWKLEMANLRQLSEYLLLDVEMTSCARNSPIQLAILSVKTYLQRCQMGIEPGVSEVKIPPVWWEWIMNYRLWEANRKVFLYPENYIDPSLRRDASPIFKELQDELLQSEITAATVEVAYHNYFDKLAELAKLQIVDSGRFFVQTPKSPEPIETLLILAKTLTQPQTFYYRTCERPSDNKPLWGHWQKIDLQINSDYLAPVYAFNRLFVFWVETKDIERPQGNDEKPEGNDENETVKITRATIKYSFQNVAQKWVAPQDLLTDVEIPNGSNNVDDSSLGEDFWQQVYPMVVPEPSLQSGLITSVFGGLQSVLAREFNAKQNSFFEERKNNIKDSELKATIASDLLPAITTFLERYNGPNLSQGRLNLAATTVENLAIFAGGVNAEAEISDRVDIFEYQDGTLVRKEHNLKLSVGRQDLVATTVGNLAIFAGGTDGGYLDVVDVFAYQNGTLVKKEHNLKLSVGCSHLAATTVGNLAIFAGGMTSEDFSDVIDVFAYQNGELVKKEHNLNLSEARSRLAATTVGNFAIFAGGSTPNYLDVVDVFAYQNGTLVRKELNLNLSEARSFFAATTVGDLAIFAGGFDDKDNYSDVVDVFEYQNGTLVKKEHDLELSVPRSRLAATTVGNLAIFAGGYHDHILDAVDVFEYQHNSLVKKERKLELSEARRDLPATTVGNLASRGTTKLVT